MFNSIPNIDNVKEIRKKQEEIEASYRLAEERSRKGLFVYKPCQEREKRLLLPKNSDMKAVFSSIDTETSTANFIAVLNKYPDFDLKFCNKNKNSAIFIAIKRNNFEIVKYLCEKDSSLVNSTDIRGCSPLIAAIIFRKKLVNGEPKKINFQIMQTLVKAGVDVNLPSKISRDGFWKTPLRYAMNQWDNIIVTFLLSQGAKRSYLFSPDRTQLYKQEFDKCFEYAYTTRKHHF